MDNKVFPLYLPSLKTSDNNGSSIVIAEVSESLVQLQSAKIDNDNIIFGEYNSYFSSEYKSFSEVFNQFINENRLDKPKQISIAVAAPVLQRKSLSNKLVWPLEVDGLKSELGIAKIDLINDTEAAGYGLHKVNKEQLLTIYEGDGRIKGNVAILAPGKGLGEAGLFWDGEFLRPFATEGGHSEFSPRTDWEVQFYQFLKKIYSIVSWETVLSEEGLLNIYRFLRDVKQHEEPKWLLDKLENGKPFEVIIEVALKKECRICTVALDYFVEFMAREANNLVLKLKATGGLVITGDIPNLISDILNKDKFYKNFLISDKMEEILKDIPIYLLRDPKLNIKGAAYFNAFY